MRTAVVILNWNTKDYLRRFLPPLLDSLKGLDAGVVVADNASGDGSRELLEEEFPDVTRIEFDENLGFTGGYDKAVAQLLGGSDGKGAGAPEYLVLLNSDVEVPSGWLQPLVSHLDLHPRCGVCGPKLLALRRRGDGYVRTGEFEYAGAAGGLLDRYGYPFCRGRVPGRTETDSGQYDKVKQVFWVSGACLATRASLWRRLGGLDGRFLAHMEEIDFCWRAQRYGYSIAVEPASVVYHLGGGTLPTNSPRKTYLNYRNNLYMLYKNLPSCRVWYVMPLRMCFDGLSAAVYLLQGRLTLVKQVWRAHMDFYKALRSLRVKRSLIHANTSPDLYKQIFEVIYHGSIVMRYYVGKRKFGNMM